MKLYFYDVQCNTFFIVYKSYFLRIVLSKSAKLLKLLNIETIITKKLTFAFMPKYQHKKIINLKEKLNKIMKT